LGKAIAKLIVRAIVWANARRWWCHALIIFAHQA
jgi:hypothetical protein